MIDQPVRHVEDLRAAEKRETFAIDRPEGVIVTLGVVGHDCSKSGLTGNGIVRDVDNMPVIVGERLILHRVDVVVMARAEIVADLVDERVIRHGAIQRGRGKSQILVVLFQVGRDIGAAANLVTFTDDERD